MEEQGLVLDREGAVERRLGWLIDGVATKVNRECGAPMSYGRGRSVGGSVEERLKKLNWRDKDVFGFGLEGVWWMWMVSRGSGDSVRKGVSTMASESN